MFRYVNQAAEKVDGMALVTGEEKYTDDFKYMDMLYVAILHSGYAHAKIEELDDSEARKMDGVIEVLSYKNAGGILYTTAGQGYPEPSPYDTCLFN
ncbi:MAG: aldehyde oxidase, partial [Ignavibacteria bacterium]|nr:aldehyde oxidase [Ignavibacteria bacterium]